MRERERYLLKSPDAVSSGANIIPGTLKASFDTDLLLSLVTLEQFAGVSDIADVTEDHFKTWLAAKDEDELETMSLTSSKRLS